MDRGFREGGRLSGCSAGEKFPLSVSEGKERDASGETEDAARFCAIDLSRTSAIRAIAARVGVAPSTVRETLRRAAAAGLV